MGESILKSQHAFMKGKSTTTQLTQISHLISESVDIHGLVEALYLNFSKAFDRVIEMVHILSHRTQAKCDYLWFNV